jgi:DNA polymerase-3 subunit delta'
MGFSEIIGHKKQLEILRSALSNQRLHHAYLFVGAEGVGKRTTALALARAIHCTEVVDDYCGRCVNCARIIDRNHPDVRFIEPLAGKKEISIQQIRELERELKYRSFTGKRKIAIIDPAVLMNLTAQNALLKTLEEPPEDSLIILIAPNAGGLLATIRSRCLPLSFAPLQRAQVATFLRSQYAVKSEDAEFLAAMSMGSIGAATKLDKDELIEQRRVWTDVLNSLKAGDYQAAMSAAELLAESRDEALRFLKWAESWYRDLLIHRVTNDSAELLNLDLRQEIERQGVDTQVGRILASIESTVGASAAIQRNLNRRMVLEQLLFSVVGGR